MTDTTTQEKWEGQGDEVQYTFVGNMLKGLANTNVRTQERGWK